MNIVATKSMDSETKSDKVIKYDENAVNELFLGGFSVSSILSS